MTGFVLVWILIKYYLAAPVSWQVIYTQPMGVEPGIFEESKDDYILYCNREKSLFLIEPNIEAEIASHAFSEDQWNSEKDKIWITKDLNKSKVTQYAKSIQLNCYVIEEAVHPMKWKIEKETKTIAGVNVQKARCYFRGRYFTAWFAPSIQMKNGPWKLGGLPGLILEAYDDKKEVWFLFESIKPVNWIPDQLPVMNGRKVTLKTYLRLNEMELRQYLDLLSARFNQLSPDIHFEWKIANYTNWEYPL